MALVREIREVARQVGGGGCCLVRGHSEQPRVLRIFTSNDSRLGLSAEVKERFWKENSAA
jgi:hypothetical protein